MKATASEAAVEQLRAAAPQLDEVEIAALASLNPSPQEIQVALILAEKGDPPASAKTDTRVSVVARIYEAVRRHVAPPDDQRR